MPRFMIESEHTDEECLMVLKNLLAAGYLTHFDWGCDVGAHCGWAILDANDEAEARMVVPSLVREKARVVQVGKYTSEDLQKEESLHKKK